MRCTEGFHQIVLERALAAALGGTLLIMSIGCQSGKTAGSAETNAQTAALTPAGGSGQGGANGTGTQAEPPKPEEPRFKRFKKPETVRGIYLTAWGAGSTKKLDKMVALLDRTELNALVIDVRDAGEMYFKMGIEEADKSGANKIAVADPVKLMDRLEAAGAYPIARIACFRDNFVPKKYPERAVQTPNGSPWRDRAGYAWLDPYNKDNWEYLAKTVEWAIDAGFPEIQLDYVRFPSEGKSSTQRFPAKSKYADQNAKPEDVIAAFAKFIGDKVRAKGAAYSADIFGIISSGTVDQGIGQALEKVAEPFDLICPMVYPSHFAKGEYKVADPNRMPYQIVSKSLADYKKRLPNKPLRPWLQDFSLGYRYGKTEVMAQIKAARELGYNEYLIWNPQNRYSEAAYGGPDKKNGMVAEKQQSTEPKAPQATVGAS